MSRKTARTTSPPSDAPCPRPSSPLHARPRAISRLAHLASALPTTTTSRFHRTALYRPCSKMPPFRVRSCLPVLPPRLLLDTQLVVQRGSAPHTRLFPPAPRGVGTGGVVVIIIMLVFSYSHVLCGPSWRGMYVCAGRRSGEWACGGSTRHMAYGVTAQRFGAGPPLPSLTKVWW